MGRPLGPVPISGVATPGDTATYSWPAQAGATDYEVVRTTVPSFAIGCVTFLSTVPNISDPVDPMIGEVLCYLIRATAPNTGSFGEDSAKVERTVLCGEATWGVSVYRAG